MAEEIKIKPSKGQGSVWSIGKGNSGELGNGNPKSREIIPYRIRTLSNIIAVSSGWSFCLWLDSSGNVFAFGETSRGRTGVPACPTPTRVPQLTQIQKISWGYWHSMAIDSQGRVLSTGYNKHGQLGLGDTTDRATFTPGLTGFSHVNWGGHFSLAINTTGELVAWGHQAKSGLGKASAEFKPVEMPGDVVYCEAGMMHAAAVCASGQLYTWGFGDCGQLGHGNRKNCIKPKLVKRLSNVQIIQASVTVGEKNSHSAAVDSNRIVYTWGSGYKGKLGLDAHWSHEDPADRLVPTQIADFQADKVICGGIYMSAVSAGSLFTWGCGSDGRLGHPEVEGHRYLFKEPVPRKVDTLEDHNVVDISSSYYSSLILTN